MPIPGDARLGMNLRHGIRPEEGGCVGGHESVVVAGIVEGINWVRGEREKRMNGCKGETEEIRQMKSGACVNRAKR